MSEEIENAAMNVPRAIFTTMVINGVMGFGMMLAILFCIGDAEKVLVGASYAKAKWKK
jgi:choline transport protein